MNRPIRHYFSTVRPEPEDFVQTLFSTSNVHPRDRFDYWHSVACKTIVDHDSRPKCRGTFQAELQWGTLDDLELVLFANSPMDISNPRATADQLFVCRQMAGAVALEQHSRELILERGDITLIDPWRQLRSEPNPGGGTIFRFTLGAVPGKEENDEK